MIELSGTSALHRRRVLRISIRRDGMWLYPRRATYRPFHSAHTSLRRRLVTCGLGEG